MESIFVRVQRIVSANIEMGMSAVERASSGSLMREAIREVERAEDEARAELHAARCRRTQAELQKALLRDRIAGLEEQARFALSKERPDLAGTAVARQLDHEAQVKQLDKTEAEAADEEKRLDECLAALKLRKAQMEKELAPFKASRCDTAAATNVCGSPAERAKRKASRAETMFERAMAAAGAPGPGLMDPDESAKLAEVDALRREAAIAERLAAMKAAQEKAAAKGGRPAKRA
ncbi:MAG: phage shock protein [Sphingomonadales bacterium]|nr:phage shock protein [Sphingomonadales bacterium]